MDDRQPVDDYDARATDRIAEPLSYTPYPPAAPPVPSDGRTPKRARGGPGRTLATGLIGALIGAALVGAGVYIGSRSVAPAAAPASQPVASGSTRVAVSVPTTQPIETAAAAILPSVVNVAVQTQSGSAVGSGVIIRSDGYILTNNHVVDGATSISVRLGTGSYAARVVGTDPTSDIAVIKVNKSGLLAAAIGRSSDLLVGETVLAVGSPFGLDKTVTSGIVSALHRSNLIQGSTGVTAYTDLVQTDAAINPGNSGGALVDMTGALVALNTLIESPSGQLGASQSAGIGFAIPIDYAISVADQLIAGKHVTHPYLGISAMTVDAGLAQWYGLSSDTGALVTQVAANSPAEKAGIRSGDIILKFGSTTVTSSDDMFMTQLKSPVNTPVSIEIDRNGTKQTVSVTLVAQ
jgi:putative serine protease PepD